MPAAVISAPPIGWFVYASTTLPESDLPAGVDVAAGAALAGLPETAVPEVPWPDMGVAVAEDEPPISSGPMEQPLMTKAVSAARAKTNNSLGRRRARDLYARINNSSR